MFELTQLNQKLIREHIYNCLYDDTVENTSNKNPTFSQCVLYFYECFKEEYDNDYNKKLCPSITERMKRYINGLAFGFEYETHKQKEMLLQWFSADEVKKADVHYIYLTIVVAVIYKNLKYYINRGV